MRTYVRCDPPPGVDTVEGFVFQRDQTDIVVARCVRCRVGFVVSGNGEAASHAMRVHRELEHCGAA